MPVRKNSREPLGLPGIASAAAQGRQTARPHMEDAQMHKIPGLIRRLYDVTCELERIFSRPFTPDGHLVGSIGEVVAAYLYDLELLGCSSQRHDATAKCDGRHVQVKLTAGTGHVGIYQEPEHLIVLQLVKHQRFDEIFNGPGRLVSDLAGKRQKNGQRAVSLYRLRQLQCDVDARLRLPRVRELPLSASTEVQDTM